MEICKFRTSQEKSRSREPRDYKGVAHRLADPWTDLERRAI